MSRPTLLLLPGLLCDRAAWSPLLPSLAERADCLIPDYSELSSLEAMASRVLAAAPPSFAVAGHSLGGRVAIEIMRHAPARVERLALFDTGYRPFPEGEAGANERAGREALLALARAQGMRAMGLRWSEPMVHPARRNDLALMGAILDMIERQTPERFAAQIRALLARPDAAPVLRAVRCPTLVLCGRDDAWSPVEQHREIAALVPGAELAIIDDCGHMSMMERPEEVAGAMLRWLARDTPSRTSSAPRSGPAMAGLP